MPLIDVVIALMVVGILLWLLKPLHSHAGSDQGEPSHTAGVWKHAAADEGIAAASRVGAPGR
jgi:hypothetical protein